MTTDTEAIKDTNATTDADARKETDYTKLSGAQLLDRRKRALEAKQRAEQALKRIAQESRRLDSHMKIMFTAWMIGASKKRQIAQGDASPLFSAVAALAKTDPMPEELADWYAEQKTAIMEAKARPPRKPKPKKAAPGQPEADSAPAQDEAPQPQPQAARPEAGAFQQAPQARRQPDPAAMEKFLARKAELAAQGQARQTPLQNAPEAPRSA